MASARTPQRSASDARQLGVESLAHFARSRLQLKDGLHNVILVETEAP